MLDVERHQCVHLVGREAPSSQGGLDELGFTT